MYNTRPGLLIGFHGCDRVRQQQLLNGPANIPFSDKPFDWLGHGMYFWENNYQRALQWANDKCKRGGKIFEPAVIGAVIDLSYCCDFLDDCFIKMIASYYDLLSLECLAFSQKLPVNNDVSGDHHKDRLMRFLDCATIEFMHESIRKRIAGEVNETGYASLKLFDSVRGVFLEGGEAYPGAGISAKSHIQICIRNPNCIKGFFVKREEMDFLLNELSRN